MSRHCPTITMTKAEALAYVKSQECQDNWDRDRWNAAKKVLMEYGICIACASCSEPMISHMLPWKPGNREEFAGRECPNCEEFYPCGDQPEYAEDCCYSGAFDGHSVTSDADPGL